jgi:hypothetical protein
MTLACIFSLVVALWRGQTKKETAMDEEMETLLIDALAALAHLVHLHGNRRQRLRALVTVVEAHLKEDLCDETMPGNAHDPVVAPQRRDRCGG